MTIAQRLRSWQRRLKPIFLRQKRQWMVLFAGITLLSILIAQPTTARQPAKAIPIESLSVEISARLAHPSSPTFHPSHRHRPSTKNSATPNPIAQGQRFYAAGQFQNAAQTWETAATHYAETGDKLREALSWAYSSLARQDLGEWDVATTASDRSFAALNNAPTRADAIAVRAIALNSRGRLAFLMGDAVAALDAWQNAEIAYRQAENPAGELGVRLNQIQALQRLGRYERSRSQLSEIVSDLDPLPDSPLKVEALHNLGVVLQVVGNLQESQGQLETGLEIARRLQQSELEATLQFALGNTLRDRGQIPQALNAYQAAIDGGEGILAAEAALNQLRLYVVQKNIPTARDRLPQVRQRLQNLPPSRPSTYARVHLATTLTALGNRSEAAQLLSVAVEHARDLGDRRARSYALGHLANLYERAQQWSEAQQLTQDALTQGQTANGRDLTVLWQWQLARILEAQGRLEESLTLYRDTVGLLDELRLDLLAIDPEVAFPYRDRIEPVYRGLVSLLLQTGEFADSTRRQQQILEARSTLDALRLAELDNFFRENCLEAESVPIERLDPSAAVFYTAMLPDRLATIVSVAGEPPFISEVRQPRSQIEAKLDLYLQSLNPGYAREYRLAYSADIYDWLVRPVQELLAQKQIETLVFVPDGMLRNIPLASLYDRDTEEYLVEQYSLALTQSLQLFETRSLDNGEFQAIVAGLSEARQGFGEIPAVESEVRDIADVVPASVLLNPEFTRDALIDLARSARFNIIHLATHGQFSSNADETFLLTWDDRINVKDLDRVLQSTPLTPNPIDLLVLSACQTAAGDDRATLGLAGFALRSGARSTLATLWSVQDNPTAELMVEFYRQLEARSGREKAESLRQAQLSLLRSQSFHHPAYWSPFVLIGNWL